MVSLVPEFGSNLDITHDGLKAFNEALEYNNFAAVKMLLQVGFPSDIATDQVLALGENEIRPIPEIKGWVGWVEKSRQEKIILKKEIPGLPSKPFSRI